MSVKVRIIVDHQGQPKAVTVGGVESVVSLADVIFAGDGALVDSVECYVVELEPEDK